MMEFKEKLHTFLYHLEVIASYYVNKYHPLERFVLTMDWDSMLQKGICPPNNHEAKYTHREHASPLPHPLRPLGAPHRDVSVSKY